MAPSAASRDRAAARSSEETSRRWLGACAPCGTSCGTCLAARIPGLSLNGHRDLRLPNTVNVRFPDTTGDPVLAGAPEVAASTGSACHEGHEQASAVILAMEITPEDALGSVRLTLGRGTAEGDIARAGEALVRSWQRLVTG